MFKNYLKIAFRNLLRQGGPDGASQSAGEFAVLNNVRRETANVRREKCLARFTSHFLRLT